MQGKGILSSIIGTLFGGMLGGKTEDASAVESAQTAGETAGKAAKKGFLQGLMDFFIPSASAEEFPEGFQEETGEMVTGAIKSVTGETKGLAASVIGSTAELGKGVGEAMIGSVSELSVAANYLAPKFLNMDWKEALTMLLSAIGAIAKTIVSILGAIDFGNAGKMLKDAGYFVRSLGKFIKAKAFLSVAKQLPDIIDSFRNKNKGGNNSKQQGNSFVDMCKAVLMMAAGIYLIGTMNEKQLTKGCTVLGSFVGAIVAMNIIVANINKKAQQTATGKEPKYIETRIKYMADIIKNIAIALVAIAVIPEEQLKKGTIALSAMLLIISGLFVITAIALDKLTKGSYEFNADAKIAIKGIIPMVFLVTVLTNSIKKLIEVFKRNPLDSVAAVETMAGFIAGIAVIVRMLSKTDISIKKVVNKQKTYNNPEQIKNIATALVQTAESIAILAAGALAFIGAIYLVRAIGATPGELVAAGVTLAGVIGAMFLVNKIISKFDPKAADNKQIVNALMNSLIMVANMIAVMGPVIASMLLMKHFKISWQEAIAYGTVIAAVIAAVGIMLHSMKSDSFFKELSSFKGPLAKCLDALIDVGKVTLMVAGMLAPIIGAIKIMKSMNVDGNETLKWCGAIAIIFAGIGIMVLAFSNMYKNAKETKLLGGGNLIKTIVGCINAAVAVVSMITLIMGRGASSKLSGTDVNGAKDLTALSGSVENIITGVSGISDALGEYKPEDIENLKTLATNISDAVQSIIEANKAAGGDYALAYFVDYCRDFAAGLTAFAEGVGEQKDADGKIIHKGISKFQNDVIYANDIAVAMSQAYGAINSSGLVKAKDRISLGAFAEDVSNMVDGLVRFATGVGEIMVNTGKLDRNGNTVMEKKTLADFKKSTEVAVGIAVDLSNVYRTLNGETQEIVENQKENGETETRSIFSMLQSDTVSLTDFAEQVENLGAGLQTFAKSCGKVYDADENEIFAGMEALKNDTAAAVTIAESMAGIANALDTEKLSKTSVLWGLIETDSTFDNFGNGLETLGNGLHNFCTQVAGMAEYKGDVDVAVTAAGAMQELSNSLSPDGGIASFFVTADNFAENADAFATFGRGISGFASALAELGEKGIQTSSINEGLRLISIISESLYETASGGDIAEIAGNEGAIQQAMKRFMGSKSSHELFAEVCQSIAAFGEAIANLNGAVKTVELYNADPKKFMESIETAGTIFGTIQEMLFGAAEKNFQIYNVSDMMREYNHLVDLINGSTLADPKKLEGMNSVGDVFDKLLWADMDGSAISIVPNLDVETMKNNIENDDNVIATLGGLGSWIVSAIKQKITDNNSGIKNKIKTMIQDACKAATDELNKVDKDYNTVTIQPVIDLSDIPFTVESINAMLSGIESKTIGVDIIGLDTTRISVDSACETIRNNTSVQRSLLQQVQGLNARVSGLRSQLSNLTVTVNGGRTRGEGDSFVMTMRGN